MPADLSMRYSFTTAALPDQYVVIYIQVAEVFPGEVRISHITTPVVSGIAVITIVKEGRRLGNLDPADVEISTAYGDAGREVDLLPSVRVDAVVHERRNKITAR